MKAFLRSLEVLSGLSDQEIDLLARTCREVRFGADERILRQGERADAAYILKEGQAEAMIEKPGAEPLRLSAILPGEFFGEMALFDDSPRSASVAASTDCTVVEIRRDAFLQEIAHNPAAAMKLLAAIARRLRRAERVVSDFSDRIYGDVLPRLQEAVAAQLESAKTICEESRRHAEATIEQARHLQTTTDHHWTNLVRMGSVVGIVLLGGGALATFLGFDKIDSVAERTVTRMSNSWTAQFSASLSEVEQLKSATETLKVGAEDFVREFKERIGKDLQDLEVMRHTALEFDKMRRDMQLIGPDRAIGRSGVSGDIARDFIAAQLNLMEEYFRQPSRWESQILIEALDLLTAALDRRYMAVHDDDWELITETVVQALKGPPEHWRQRLKLSEVTVKLYGHMVDARYQRGARAMIGRLEALLGSGAQTPAAASLTATILARLGSDSPLVKTQLRTQQQSESPWRRSQASVDLVALGEADAWAPLLQDIAGQFAQAKRGENGQARQARREAAFAAAHLIAEAAVERGLPARRYFDSAALDMQLVADRLGVPAESWPPDAPEGAPLIDFTILDGLTSEPSRWNRLYWRYSCDLLCELGCSSPGAVSAGNWCTQCLDALQTQYFRHGTGIDRSAESCAGQ